jgi:cell division protein FtsB
MTCPVCTLRAECEDLAKANQELRDEVERRAAENARLQDGVSGLIRAIYQTAMRKPAMRKPSP